MGWEIIAMLAMSAVSGLSSANSASKQAEASAAMAQANAQRQIDELSRQESENNAKAAQEKSDRMRAAEKELAAARVASAEGFSMGDRLMQEIGYNEGLDLSRIETSRQNYSAAIKSRMNAAAFDANQQIKAADQQAKQASNSAFMGMIGSGISIVSGGYNQAIMKAAVDKTTAPTFSQWAFGK